MYGFMEELEELGTGGIEDLNEELLKLEELGTGGIEDTNEELLKLEELGTGGIEDTNVGLLELAASHPWFRTPPPKTNGSGGVSPHSSINAVAY